MSDLDQALQGLSVRRAGAAQNQEPLRSFLLAFLDDQERRLRAIQAARAKDS